MSKKKKIRQANAEIFSAKQYIAKNIKRYGIILLCSVPFILIFNYIMAKNVEGYNGTVVFFVSFAMLLLACLIGVIIFTKKDDKIELNKTEEQEKDPFAD